MSDVGHHGCILTRMNDFMRLINALNTCLSSLLVPLAASALNFSLCPQVNGSLLPVVGI